MSGQWKRALFWCLVSTLVLGGIAFGFWPRPELADLAVVARGPLVVTIREEGRTRVREVYTVSAPVAGRLLRVSQNAGDPVTAGQTIVAQLQPSDPTFLDIRTRTQAEAAAKAAEAALTLAKAEVERARAALQFAEVDLKRSATLAQRGTASQAELDRARLLYRTRVTEMGTAEASLQVKEFELETARALLIDPSEETKTELSANSYISITAPVTGRVLRVLQENETIVPAGTPILEIGDRKDLEVVVDLLSTEAVKVQQGASARLTDWGGAEALNARVQRVEPYGFTKISALGVEEQRVNAILDITSPHHEWTALGHGFKVDAVISIWEGADVVVAPLGAFFRHGGRWAAFVVRDGVARLTFVTLGHVTDTQAEVLSGLVPDEIVVLHPSDRIEDGIGVVARGM
ncbi:MAG: HlyD family efflux transporter periplasmic adaptor subunit [Alphaproteobacteria bacterium]|nr:HlyD family efflux transporter periplasmic adaptor subunit [Alphaproteobacteria bacterium]